MLALDGNAMAGELFEVFGREMTTSTGACGHCGTRTQIAELRVYLRAPGVVARCPACQGVVIVLVDVHGTARADLENFGLEEPPTV